MRHVVRVDGKEGAESKRPEMRERRKKGYRCALPSSNERRGSGGKGVVKGEGWETCQGSEATERGGGETGLQIKTWE